MRETGEKVTLTAMKKSKKANRLIAIQCACHGAVTSPRPGSCSVCYCVVE